MKNLVLIMGLVCAAAASADEPGKADPAKPQKHFAAATPAEMKFQEMKAPGAPSTAPGTQVAALWGNLQKGASGAEVKIPAGEKHPLHTHTANVRGVVISGTWIIGPDQASAKEYGPGSFFFTPGGWPHYSACKEGAECVLYQDTNAPFDIKMEGAAPAPATAAAK
ncbi:MAG TPA: cupin domain-containing protein [Myxococcales bacterium]|nr:cupin domain-containing protein [Myxococcales bacterium]